MRFRVRHLSRYTYDRPVFLEPHTLRLRPWTGGGQRVLDYRCSVSPSPSARSALRDVYGNSSERVWFMGLHDALTVEAEYVAESHLTNPFDYLLDDPESCRLPLEYVRSEAEALIPFRHSDRTDPAVAEFAEGVAYGVDRRLLPFLDLLCRSIHEQIEFVLRPKGDALEPSRTLAGRMGACRDLATLFVACCRSEGIAARFVSGVQEPDDEAHLHAWAEAYIPGDGWRGYDPSTGLATADRYLGVATGPEAADAAPITGRFRGDKASAMLQTELSVVTEPLPVD